MVLVGDWYKTHPRPRLHAAAARASCPGHAAYAPLILLCSAVAGLAPRIPSSVCSGLADAYLEGGRVRTSRVFFTLNVACLLLYLVLVSFKLGALTDDIFRMSTFTFLASSMACSTVTS